MSSVGWPHPQRDNEPNVSPKEIFSHYKEDQIVVANIASPQSERNIRGNEKVCVSFIDILVQKGFQIKGRAQIVSKGDPGFKEMELILTRMTSGKFPFFTITRIHVDRVKPILAPSYLFFPETREEDQIKSAKQTYGV